MRSNIEELKKVGRNMRELSDIQADLLECCDVRKMIKMGDLLDELTDLFERDSNKKESEE